MIRPTHLALACASLALCACEPTSQAKAAGGQTQPPSPAPSNDPGAAPRASETEPVFMGEGSVRYTAPEELARQGALVLERQRWKTDEDEGVAWRVRAPRAEVAGIDEVAPFTTLHPSGTGWAAVNGGFYEAAPGGGYRAMGVVIADGERLGGYRVRGGSGVFWAGAESGHGVVHRSKWKEIERTKPAHALQSIDRIVAGGESVVNGKPGAREAARSAVAVRGDEVTILISAHSDSVVETGENAFRLRSTRLGMTLKEWSDFVLETTGATDALNLDGGVSTQLSARIGGVSLDVVGERGTLNAVVVRP